MGEGQGAGGGLKWPHTALIKSKCKNSRQKLKEKCGDKELWLEEEVEEETGQQGDCAPWLIPLQCIDKILE